MYLAKRFERLTKPKKVLMIITVISVIIGVMIVIYNPNYETGVINGTFLSEQSPRTMIVFDQNNHNRFSYYYIDSNNQQVADMGKYYETENEHIFIVKSKLFDHVKIEYTKNQFDIEINGINYKYKLFDKVPTMIENSNIVGVAGDMDRALYSSNLT